MSDRPPDGPPLPPEAAFAIGGRVPAAVVEALREARRLRDGWRAATHRAEARAEAEARRRLARRLAAVNRWVEGARRRLRAEAMELAQAAAARLVAESRARTPLWWRPVLDAPLEGEAWLALHLPPAEVAAWGDAPLPAGVRLVADAALGPGDLVLVGPGGRADVRVATQVASVLAVPR